MDIGLFLSFSYCVIFWNLYFVITCPQGARKSYKDILDVSWGDPHRAGVKPLSFVRQVIHDLQRLLILKLQYTAKWKKKIFVFSLHNWQVLAACFYPQLMNSNELSVDIRQRAQKLFKACDGGSIGKSVII